MTNISQRIAEHGDKQASKKNSVYKKLADFQDRIDELREMIQDLDARLKMIEDTVIDWGKFKVNERNLSSSGREERKTETDIT